MEEILDAPEIKNKIYREKAFWPCTFLGGPLVATYLLAENFKALGRFEMVSKTWIIGILSTILIFGGAFLIPESVNIPRQVIPIVYSSIAFGIFKKFQAKEINDYIDSGASHYKAGRLILITLIGMLPALVLGLLFVLATDIY